ncbi:MAG TPA: putative toxin-antitoxin system toxin component, PIN family [Blastocatellia bacterium]|nr:putative toxin-antitoxin system toxin component, PIN family [Blastocatellia bacterium]
MADTNTVVSGLLWQGPPRRVLDSARLGQIALFTSFVLIVELEDVLKRDKFARRLEQAAVTSSDLVLGYAALATLVSPMAIGPVILADADDDAVLACALAAQAEAIVSGDRHLLSLRKHEGINILTATELLKELNQRPQQAKKD